MLEPDAGRLASPVPRGARRRKAPGLPDASIVTAPEPARLLCHDCDHAVDVDDVLLVSPRGRRYVTALGQTESRNLDFTHGREHEVSTRR